MLPCHESMPRFRRKGKFRCKGSNDEENMASHSRGIFGPSFAPFLAPLLSKRARKGRAPAGAPHPWAKKCTRCRMARQPDQSGLPARWFVQRLAPCPVSSSPSDCRRSIEGPIESMHPPQGVMPGITPHDLRRRDRSLLFTDTRSRVCSPSRLPRKRFAVPAIRTVRVHRILARDFRRFAIRPSHRAGCILNTAIPNSNKTEYFREGGLTEFLLFRPICPPGKCQLWPRHPRQQEAVLCTVTVMPNWVVFSGAR